jgi:membrane associated rhomboid family serine protease
MVAQCFVGEARPEMEGTLSTIRARTRRQAMDWGLVLTSQGIEVIIDRHPQAHGWVLLVGPDDYARAIDAIRKYREENRGWAWRQQLAWTELSFHWGVLLWCWVLIVFFWLSDVLGEPFEKAGVVSSLAVKQGEWWRLFTAVCLHADVGHLAANVSTGLVLLGLAMARFGPGWAALATYLAGVGGNLLGVWLRLRPYDGLGASGMVMGALGLLAVHSVTLLRRGAWAARQVMTSALGGFLLFVLLGLSPASDVLAHFGGFVWGALLGAVLALLPERILQNLWMNVVTVVLAAALAALSWARAL